MPPLSDPDHKAAAPAAALLKVLRLAPLLRLPALLEFAKAKAHCSVHLVRV